MNTMLKNQSSDELISIKIPGNPIGTDVGRQSQSKLPTPSFTKRTLNKSQSIQLGFKTAENTPQTPGGRYGERKSQFGVSYHQPGRPIRYDGDMTTSAEDLTRSIEQPLDSKMPLINKKVQFDLDNTEIIHGVVSQITEKELILSLGNHKFS